MPAVTKRTTICSVNLNCKRMYITNMLLKLALHVYLTRLQLTWGNSSLYFLLCRSYLLYGILDQNCCQYFLLDCNWFCKTLKKNSCHECCYSQKKNPCHEYCYSEKKNPPHKYCYSLVFVYPVYFLAPQWAGKFMVKVTEN